MTRDEARAKIEALLSVAEQENEFGGDEDENGDLALGRVDFQRLKQGINLILGEVQ